MLKFVESAVTFSEFPNEISLVFSISNCPNHCNGCSSPYLAQDIGTELTQDLLNNLISKNPGITLIGFLGDGNDLDAICNLSNFIHTKYNLKTGIYSGRNYIDFRILEFMDYYKIGEYRSFEGPEDTWKNQTAGPISLPTSNQVMFKKDGSKLINITDEFRKNKINNWKTVIL